MKKIIIASSILVAVFSLNSCDKIKDQMKKVESTKIDSFSANSGDENRDIIKFNNAMVKLDNDQTSFIKDFSDRLDRMDEFVKQSLSSSNSYAIAPIFTPVISRMYDEVEVPKVLDGPIKGQLETMNSTITELKALNKELATYKEAQDWKDDKGKKLAEIRTKADALISENRKAADALFATLEKKADVAEVAILKDHPLKEQILSSKEILNLVQKIVDDSYEYDDVNAYKTKFDQQYQQLEKLYSANIAKTLPSGEEAKSRSYQNFNDAVNRFLGDMRIAKRSLADNASSLNSDLDGLDSQAKTVLSNYNSFVD
jgi:hypothetical protein